MQAVQNTQQDDFKTYANGTFWEQFYSDFSQHALERANTGIIKNNNLVIPLFENTLMRVNLLALEPGKDLPLHDHPGSAGAMMVISGGISAMACEQTEKMDNTNYSRTLLTVTGRNILSAGETGCFTQKQHNIHSFNALTERAVLIVVHTPPFAAIQQSFFFTVPPLQKVGSQILVQRVRAQVAEKFLKNNIQGIVIKT